MLEGIRFQHPELDGRLPKKGGSAKGETGMDHFELRRYKAVMRHLILTMTSILFLMRESARLEKKRQLESVAGAGDTGAAA